jgi:hypothetical protein
VKILEQEKCSLKAGRSIFNNMSHNDDDEGISLEASHFHLVLQLHYVLHTA